MTDFSQTITNRVGVYGGSTTVKWNVLEWGTDNWAFDGDLIVEVGKVVSSSFSPTTALSFDVAKVLDSQSLTMTSAEVFSAEKTLTGSTLSMSDVLNGITLVDSEGFYRVFRGNTTEGEDKIISDYTEGADPSDSWSEVSPPSTSWS